MKFMLRRIAAEVRWTIALAVALALAAAPAMAVIDVNPQMPVGPVVKRWGWDLKGGQGLTNTSSETQTHYGDVAANLVRIPFFANAHFSNGTVDTSRYSTMIDSIKNIVAENPNVEIFASLKLAGGNSFVGPAAEPGWITAGTTAWPFDSGGRIFGNQSNRPNPEFYSKLVADYFSYLDGQGIHVDYVGINNETDGALGISRYVGTVDLLKPELANRGFNLNDIEFIAPDTYSPTTAVSIANNLNNQNRLDTFDIVGSHSYPDHNAHTRDKWVSMSNNSNGSDLWFTEAHINPSSSGNGKTAEENIARMRDGIAMVFAANKAGGGALDAQGDLIGVDSFVWWQGGNSSTAIDDMIKREVINSTIQGQPVFTTPDFSEQSNNDDAPLYQAYVQDGKLNLWIANPADEETDFVVNLATGRLLDNDHVAPTGTYWQGCSAPGVCHGTYGNTITSNSTGALSFSVEQDKSSLTIDSIPFNSVALVSFDLAGTADLDGDTILTTDDVVQFVNGWRNGSDLGDMDFDGDTDRDDWFYLRAAFDDAGMSSQLSGFFVPEPTSAALLLFGLTTLFANSRHKRS